MIISLMSMIISMIIPIIISMVMCMSIYANSRPYAQVNGLPQVGSRVSGIPCQFSCQILWV